MFWIKCKFTGRFWLARWRAPLAGSAERITRLTRVDLCYFGMPGLERSRTDTLAMLSRHVKAGRFE